MAPNKFGSRRRAMLSFERQPFPRTCHVDQDVAHSQAWRALGHLTTVGRVLSALHRRNHLTLPRTFAPGQCCHGQQGVVSIVSRRYFFGPHSDLCATALRTLPVSALCAARTDCRRHCAFGSATAESNAGAVASNRLASIIKFASMLTTDIRNGTRSPGRKVP